MQQIPIYELYFNEIEEPTFLDIALYKMYKWNNGTSVLKGKLNKLIYKLEQRKYGKCHEEKLIEGR